MNTLITLALAKNKGSNPYEFLIFLSFRQGKGQKGNPQNSTKFSGSQEPSSHDGNSLRNCLSDESERNSFPINGTDSFHGYHTHMSRTNMCTGRQISSVCSIICGPSCESQASQEPSVPSQNSKIFSANECALVEHK